MKVLELIGALSRMPSDAEVGYMYDGAARGRADHVWLARGGMVLLSDSDEYVYYTCDRPESAPTREEKPYWQTPKEPT